MRYASLSLPSLMLIGLLSALPLAAAKVFAQEDPPGPKAGVLTMTGLERDAIKSVTEPMKFYGLRRQSSRAKPSARDKE